MVDLSSLRRIFPDGVKQEITRDRVNQLNIERLALECLADLPAQRRLDLMFDLITQCQDLDGDQLLKHGERISAYGWSL